MNPQLTAPKPLILNLDRTRSRLKEIFWVALGSLVLACSARFSLPLGFTPVPISLQTLAVLLVASSLGSMRGTLAVGMYLLEGGFGLPVFTHGSGFAYLLGPTGGYLLGFLPAAFIIGKCADLGKDRSVWSALPWFLLGHSVIFFFGLSHLSTFVGWEKAIPMGLIPFLPGAVIKTAIASIALPSLWKLSDRVGLK